jgi:hypothetical protein
MPARGEAAFLIGGRYLNSRGLQLQRSREPLFSVAKHGFEDFAKYKVWGQIYEKPTIWQSTHGRGISHRRTPYKGDESSVREESYGARISKRFLP